MTPAPEPDPRDVLSAAGWTADAEPPLRITVGWDTLIWRFTRNGTPYALRLFRKTGPSPELEAAADSEQLAMKAAREAGLPVPAVEARGTFDGAPFFVLEWRPGERLLDVFSRRPWLIRRLGREFGALQARLHAVPPPPRLRVFGREWLEANVRDPRVIEAVLPAARFDTLCHLDYHPLNVLAQGGRPTGLLDFGPAGVTDRRADLAFTRLTLLAAPLPPGPLKPIFNLARRYFARQWGAGYRAVAGSFPLTPAWEVIAADHYIHEVERAVAEGRGWAGESDIAPLRAFRAGRLKAAGLPPP